MICFLEIWFEIRRGRPGPARASVGPHRPQTLNQFLRIPGPRELEKGGFSQPFWGDVCKKHVKNVLHREPHHDLVSLDVACPEGEPYLPTAREMQICLSHGFQNEQFFMDGMNYCAARSEVGCATEAEACVKDQSCRTLMTPRVAALFSMPRNLGSL